MLKNLKTRKQCIIYIFIFVLNIQSEPLIYNALDAFSTDSISTGLLNNTTNITSSGTKIRDDITLSSENQILFSQTATFDGNSKTITLPNNNFKLITIPDNATATFKNTTFENFSDENISLGTTNSKIIFGDGCVLNIIKDLTLTQTIYLGDGCIVTGENRPNVNINTGSFLVDGSNVSATIKGLNLIGADTDNLKCTSGNSVLILKNTNVTITTEWDWVNGSLSMEDDVCFKKGIFRYLSGQVSTINEKSKLSLSNNLTFSYNPSGADKKRIAFSDPTSILSLDGCTMIIQNNGMTLEKGSLELTTKNTLLSFGGSPANGLVFGDGDSVENDFLLSKAYSLFSQIYVKKGYLLNNNLQEPYYALDTETPLRYGDGLSLHHSKHSVFLGSSTNPSYGGDGKVGYEVHSDIGMIVFGNQTLDDKSRFYISKGDSGERFDTNLGEQIKSGDYVKLESYTPWTNTTVARYLTDGRIAVGSLVSTPYPPYSLLVFEPIPTITNDRRCVFRIYKRNGYVGEEIFKGDKVYLYARMTWYVGDHWQYYDNYIGSSGLATAPNGFEVYAYRFNHTNPNPATLPTEQEIDDYLVWVLSDVYQSAYQTAHSVTASTLDPVAGTLGLGVWPGTSSRQF